ncbi:MAG: discoidin domain-containing protein [Paenibacillaceae bacterium]|nr:discoidin domain-containing protein [Paenibacillaceae bacterium]
MTLRNHFRYLKALLLVAAMLAAFLALPTTPAQAADAYDDLRVKMYDMLTGGPTYDPADPDISGKIAVITSKAQTNWNSMNKSSGRTYLWSDLASTTISKDALGSYQRLEEMSFAYATRGSSLHNNAALLADIVGGMDWMYTNRYNKDVPYRGYDNWYDWTIGMPLSINTITTLIYDHLTATQIGNWHAVIDHQALKVGSGLVVANRAWGGFIKVASGIIVKSSAKISDGIDELGPVFDYVASGEGIYRDGSILQHTALIAYNGGYGVSMIDTLTKSMYIVAGSTWDITDPDINHIYEWIYSAFEPLFYNDSMMDMVRGRDISRYASDDKGLTSMGALGASVARMAYSAPLAGDRAAYKSMVKKWMNEATSPTKYADLSSISTIVQAKAIVTDPSVSPRPALVENKQYPNMARTVHLRPGFAFGISMSSDRIGNYELVNNSNLRGWHTGDGMTFLYNSDVGQYKDSFWATVNSYRLPGTTVNQNTTAAAQSKNPNSWVGGSEIAGLYGATGMQYTANGATLTAKKSWFMFDDEIVNLGAGITSADNKVVETIVENRKLNGSGNNALRVNGAAKSTALGWSETMAGVNRIHLTGNVAGSDIGYYFPGSATIKGLRESRTDQWWSINQFYPGDPEYTTDRTRNYMNLWFDHGTNPTNSQYAYVLLPGMSSAQVDAYATTPDITVVENSTDAQAAKENTLGVMGINFWNDIIKKVDIITSNKKASVMTRTTANEFEISVSDPTMQNGGYIDIQADIAAASLVSADPGVIVKQLSPTIVLSVNVNGAIGQSFKAKFNRTGTPVPLPALPPAGDNLALNKAVTASSSVEQGNYTKSRVVDGTRSSTASSAGWSSSNNVTTNHTEWVTVNLGSSKTIDRVDLYPKNDYAAGYGFPVDFTIQLSADNVNWTTAVTQTGYPMPDGSVQSFTFAPANAQYVRIHTTKIRPLLYDSNQYKVQLAEIEVYAPVNLAYNKTIAASSSYESTSWGKTKAVDAKRSSVTGSMGWTSDDNRYVNHAEWVTVDLGAVKDVGRVDLHPRNDGVNTGYGFPVDFTIQTSTDNVNWTTAVTQTGYSQPGGIAQSFLFPSASARYIKVNGTSLRANPNDANQYRMQFAEFEVYPGNLALGKTVTSSSSVENANFGVGKAVDGQTLAIPGAMGWSSNDNRNTNHTEWVTVDLGSMYNVSRVHLYQRNDGDNRGYGLPVDFTIQVSADNVNWTTVVSKTGYPLVVDYARGFAFPSASARYVKINGTNLRANPYDQNLYRMQFAEIEIYN